MITRPVDELRTRLEFLLSRFVTGGILVYEYIGWNKLYHASLMTVAIWIAAHPKYAMYAPVIQYLGQQAVPTKG